MKINIKAAKAIADALVYNNRELSREIVHAIEYYKSVQSDHSENRLLSAVTAAFDYAQKTYGLGSINSELVRTNFAAVTEVAA